MTRWQKLLDTLVGGESPPPHVQALQLPGITGWEPGRVWTRFDLPADMLQPQGVAFGGYIAAVADELVGLAAMSVVPEDAVFITQDLRVQYFRPLSGGAIEVEANVINQSRSAIHVEALFSNAENKQVAKASAVQAVKSNP